MADDVTLEGGKLRVARLLSGDESLHIVLERTDEAQCECGHWLQPFESGWRCVMGCTHQTQRDLAEPHDAV